MSTHDRPTPGAAITLTAVDAGLLSTAATDHAHTVHRMARNTGWSTPNGEALRASGRQLLTLADRLRAAQADAEGWDASYLPTGADLWASWCQNARVTP